MKIGNWIRTARKSAGLSQEQLGECLGVTKGNVSAWENNRHEPSYSQMLKIGEASFWKVPLPGFSQAPTLTIKWPFKRITLRQLSLLSSDELIRAEGMLEAVVREWEDFHSKSVDPASTDAYPS